MDRRHCLICTGGEAPAEFDAPERASGAHVGVCFGDQRLFRVMLNGEDVTMTTFQALAGPHGWVALYVTNEAGRRFLCPSRSRSSAAFGMPGAIEPHPRFKIERGDVHLVVVPPEPWRPTPLERECGVTSPPVRSLAAGAAA